MSVCISRKWQSFSQNGMQAGSITVSWMWAMPFSATLMGRSFLMRRAHSTLPSPSMRWFGEDERAHEVEVPLALVGLRHDGRCRQERHPAVVGDERQPQGGDIVIIVREIPEHAVQPYAWRQRVSSREGRGRYLQCQE